MARGDADLVKVRIPVSEDDYPGIGSELVWAAPCGGGRYRIRNVLFYAYGLSWDDVVLATPDEDGILQLVTIAQRGGHSTFRVILASPEDQLLLQRRWKPLAELGCEYERATRSLLAIDVPPPADLTTIRSILSAAEADGVWEWEEGHAASPGA